MEFDLKPRKLDLYIIGKFITTFFVALLLIIGIVIIFDISEKIDDFVSKEAPLKAIIFDYYVNFVPYFMNMFSPLFVFITVIFFTSKMAADSEIKTRTKGVGRNVHYQISPGEFVYAESFSTWNNTAYRFTLERIENNELVSKLTAETAVYNAKKNTWTLKKYFIRDYREDLTDKIRSGRQIDTTLALSVKDFQLNEKTVQTLNYDELEELIRTQEMRGDANVKLSLIEKHTRLALPFSAFILTIMGVALSSKKRRGGIGWNIGIGIALAFTYILFMRFSQMFVYTDSLPPAVALWLPNIVFTVIAAFLYRIAPK